MSGLLQRTPCRIRPDASRTLCRLFVPGHETLIRGEPRAMAVIARVLDLSEEDVETTLARIMARFSGHYRDLAGALEHHFQLVAHRLGSNIRVGHARRQLIGACFTQEYAIEAAALFNPSMVAHPDQAGCQPGEVRFIMSLRAVGEGHLSSIEFRTGTIGESGIRLDPPGRFPDTGHALLVPHDRDLFQAKLADLVAEDENARFLWDLLPSRFTTAELDMALAELHKQRLTRGESAALAERVRHLAASRYAVEFDEHSALSERVLWPAGPAESHGMEDARLVRFTEGADVTYYATYTAFDGSQVAPQLLQTAALSDTRVVVINGARPKTSRPSRSPRWQGRQRETRAWRFFPVASPAATPRSPAGTGKATRSATQPTVTAGARPSQSRR